MKTSFLRQKRSNRGSSKSINAPLMITSLVDAFSILVIYLMINSAGENKVELSDQIKIPEVQKSSDLTEAPIISISSKGYMFNNQILDLNGLKLVLTQQKSQIKQSFKDKKAIVEADQETPYSKIQPVMALMSELEIESIQLAVATEEKL